MIISIYMLGVKASLTLSDVISFYRVHKFGFGYNIYSLSFCFLLLCYISSILA